jgi:HEAT repeat protein
MAHAGGLESRIRAILDPAARRGSSRRVLVSVAAGTLLAAAGLLGVDVFGAAPEAQSAELALSERIPLAPEIEDWALHRRFEPRNEQEEQAITRIQEAARHVKQHELDFIHDRAVWALSIAHEDEIVAPLVGRLESRDWRARAYAAWCLDAVGAGQAAAEIRTLLRDPVWRVRAMAAAALVDLGDAPSGSDVLSLLEDPAWQVRMPAVQLASRLDTPESAAAIRARLNDSHVAVRNAAQAALDRIPTP